MAGKRQTCYIDRAYVESFEKGSGLREGGGERGGAKTCLSLQKNSRGGG